MSEKVLENLEYGISLNQEQLNSLYKTEDSPSNVFKPEQEEPQASADTGKETPEELSEPQKDEQPNDNAETVPSEEPFKYSHNGQDYTEEEIRSGLEALQNKNEWQKSNTQKAQQVSTEKKQLDKLLGSLNGVMNDELKEFLGEDHELFANVKESEKLLESNEQVIAEPKADRLQELENKILNMEAQKKVDRDIEVLVESHPELRSSPDALNEVLEIAVNKGLSLEDSFVFANATANGESALLRAIEQVKEAESIKKQPDPTPRQGVREEPTPQGKDWDQIRQIALDKQHYNLFKE